MFNTRSHVILQLWLKQISQNILGACKFAIPLQKIDNPQNVKKSAATFAFGVLFCCIFQPFEVHVVWHFSAKMMLLTYDH